MLGTTKPLLTPSTTSVSLLTSDEPDVDIANHIANDKPPNFTTHTTGTTAVTDVPQPHRPPTQDSNVYQHKNNSKRKYGKINSRNRSVSTTIITQQMNTGPGIKDTLISDLPIDNESKQANKDAQISQLHEQNNHLKNQIAALQKLVSQQSQQSQNLLKSQSLERSVHGGASIANIHTAPIANSFQANIGGSVSPTTQTAEDAPPNQPPSLIRKISKRESAILDILYPLSKESHDIEVPDQKFENNSDEYDCDNILDFFRNDYIGCDAYMVSVFNPNYGIKIRYCDWTASGKCCKSIENYIQHRVLPFYANTHTATSITGLFTYSNILQVCNAHLIV